MPACGGTCSNGSGREERRQQGAKRLQTRGEVELDGERYVLVDPLFGRWIERMSVTGDLALVDDAATVG